MPIGSMVVYAIAIPRQIDWKMFFVSDCMVPFITRAISPTRAPPRRHRVRRFVTSVMRKGRAKYKPTPAAATAAAIRTIPGLPSGLLQNDFGEKLLRLDGVVLMISFSFALNLFDAQTLRMEQRSDLCFLRRDLLRPALFRQAVLRHRIGMIGCLRRHFSLKLRNLRVDGFGLLLES